MNQEQREKISEKDLRKTIDEYLDLVSNNFTQRQKARKLKTYEIFPLMGDLRAAFDIYSEMNAQECGRVVITRYIKLLNLLIALEESNDRKIENTLFCVYVRNVRCPLFVWFFYFEVLFPKVLISVQMLVVLVESTSSDVR